MKMKKIRQGVGILLCFCLLAGLIPATALAEDPPTAAMVTVSGTNVTGGGYWTTDGSGNMTPCSSGDAWNVHYNVDVNALTLRNAVAKGTTTDPVTNGAGVYAARDLRIIVEGDTNTVTGVDTGSGSSGIFCGSNLTLAGVYETSKLTVSSADPTTVGGSGVNAMGDVEIGGFLTLTANGYSAGNATGINSGGTVRIWAGATVTATAGSAKASSAIRAESGISITGDARVRADSRGTTGGTGSGSYGMYVGSGTGTIVINTTKLVEASFGDKSTTAALEGNLAGMQAHAVEITNSEVQSGGKDDNDSEGSGYGIYSDTSVIISGPSDVTAYGGLTTTSYGIYAASGNITLKEGCIIKAGGFGPEHSAYTIRQAMNKAPVLDNYDQVIFTASKTDPYSKNNTETFYYNTFPSNQIADFCGLKADPGSAPTITTTSPLDRAAAGEQYEKTLAATSDLPFAWSATGNLPAGLSFEAATGKIFGTPESNAGGEYNLEFTATNKAGLDTLAATLEVYEEPNISLQPKDATVKEGDSATFEINTDAGYPAPNFQWYVSKDGGVTWEIIQDAIAKSYTTPATTLEQDGDQYRCTVTNAALPDGKHSEKATLSVEPKIVVLEIPYQKIVRQDSSAAPPAETFKLLADSLGEVPSSVTVKVENDAIATEGAKTYENVLKLTMSLEDYNQYFADGIEVSEEKGTAEHWTYDDAVWLILADVDNDGKVRDLEISPAGDPNHPVDIMTFTNTYTYAGGGSGGGGSGGTGDAAASGGGNAVMTGDTAFPIWILLSLLGVSGATLLILLLYKKNRRKGH